jgi:CRP-like cAMP-binding protein
MFRPTATEAGINSDSFPSAGYGMPAPAGVSERIAMLGTVPLLAGLDRSQLERLAKVGSERTISQGVAIVREGEQGLGFYLILSGSAEVRKGSQTLGTLLPGQFFGESALLVAQPRTADVLTTSEVRCLTIDRESFWGALGIDPNADRAKYEETVQRLRPAQTTLSE